MKIRPLASWREVEQVIEVNAISFTSFWRQYNVARERIRALIPRDRPDLSRVVEEDGKIVGYLHIVPKQVRIGRAVVSCGGIGAVCVHPRVRLKGYAAELLRDTVRHMDEVGMDMSILSGIPNFYHRFGFVEALCCPQPKFTLTLGDAQHAASKCKVRKFRRADLPALCELWDRGNEGRTGTFVRQPEYWATITAVASSFYRSIRLVVDDRGRLLGYLNLTSDTSGVTVREHASVADGDVHETMVAECVKAARRASVQSTSVISPPDHPFAEFCAGYGATMQIPHRRVGGEMARITNFERIMEVVKPELQDRIHGSQFKDYTGSFVLDTDLGSLPVVIEDGRLRTAATGRQPRKKMTMPQTALTRLLLGFKSVDALIAQKEITLSSGLLELARVLFPKGFPMKWGADGY